MFILSFLVFMLSSKHKNGLLRTDCNKWIVMNGLKRSDSGVGVLQRFPQPVFCIESKQELWIPDVMQKYMAHGFARASCKRQKTKGGDKISVGQTM